MAITMWWGSPFHRWIMYWVNLYFLLSVPAKPSLLCIYPLLNGNWKKYSEKWGYWLIYTFWYGPMSPFAQLPGTKQCLCLILHIYLCFQQHPDIFKVPPNCSVSTINISHQAHALQDQRGRGESQMTVTTPITVEGQQGWMARPLFLFSGATISPALSFCLERWLQKVLEFTNSGTKSLAINCGRILQLSLIKSLWGN